MALKLRDKAFHLSKLTYVDFKHIEPDRTLLNLYPLLRHDGFNARRRNTDGWTDIDRFKEEFTDPKNAERFVGFADHPDIVRRWLETDLLDLVNRGKPTQAVVSPRPLHGRAYKFRSSRHAKDYGSADQVYWLLRNAHPTLSQQVQDRLKQYVFEGQDLFTDRVVTSAATDVETQAILHLPDNEVRDSADLNRPPDNFPPLCRRNADLLAEDVLSLLAYRDSMPRTVLIEYLKILLTFHLGLYHLKALKLLPTLIRGRRSNLCGLESCQALSPLSPCSFCAALLVDCTGGRHDHMMHLAQMSAELHYRRIPNYVDAHFTLKKIDEMASDWRKIGKIPSASAIHPVQDLLLLLQDRFKPLREQYFSNRLVDLVKDVSADDTPPTEIQRILDLGIEDFDKYVEIIVTLRGSFHGSFIKRCLDSFLQKNSEGGLLRQGRASRSPRQFALGSKLLEVLLQLAVIERSGNRIQTREIRVDTLLDWLRGRYGIYINQLPEGDGFLESTAQDREALRRNNEAFKERLRDVGYFQDLSDAYISQTIAPRYIIT